MSLEDLIRYGRGEFSQTDSLGGAITSLGQREQDLLNEVRKYDPNANWQYVDNSSSSNEGGTRSPNSYSLVFDHTKLPRITDDRNRDLGIITSGGGMLSKYGNGSSLAYRGEVDPRWKDWFNFDDSKLASKGYRWTDDIYGDMSIGARKKQGWSDYLMQYAPMIGGTIMGLGLGGGPLMQLLTKLPSLGAGLAHGANPYLALGNLAAGFIPGIGDIPQGMTSALARMAISQAFNNRSGRG